MRVGNIVRGIADFLWPLPNSEEQLNPPEIFARYKHDVELLADDTSIDEEYLLDAIERMTNAEDARLNSIDTRGGQLMAASGIAVSLITAVATQRLVADAVRGRLVFLVGYIAALIYFSRCILLTLRVHGQRRRHKLGPDELLPQTTVGGYRRQIARTMLQNLIENYRIDNKQAEALYLAQKCLRNAVLVLVAGGLSSVVWR
jgi:hypothetical protein